jgi:AcrR family transcriptional regulator
MAEKVDRRVLRTKQALRGALTTLLRTRSYDQITVEDILNEANVGRSTFYSHCRGKEDLLRRGLQMLRTELGEPAKMPHTARPATGFAFSLKMLEHVAEHRKVFPSISRGRGREVVLQELRSVSLALLREELASAPPDSTIPRELTEELVIGAFMSLLVFWLEHNTRYTPAALDAQFQRFMSEGVGKRRTASAPTRARRT